MLTPIHQLRLLRGRREASHAEAAQCWNILSTEETVACSSLELDGVAFLETVGWIHQRIHVEDARARGLSPAEILNRPVKLISPSHLQIVSLHRTSAIVLRWLPVQSDLTFVGRGFKLHLIGLTNQVDTCLSLILATFVLRSYPKLIVSHACHRFHSIGRTLRLAYLPVCLSADDIHLDDENSGKRVSAKAIPHEYNRPWNLIGVGA